MKTRKIVVGSLALGIASAVGLGFAAAQLRAAAEIRLTDLQAKISAQTAAIRQLENSIAAIAKNASPQKPATPKPPTIPQFQPYRAPLTDSQLWAADSALQRLYLRSEQSRIEREYAPLLTALSLSPELAARFHQIYATHTADRLDLRIAYEPVAAARFDPAVIGAANKRELDRFNAALLELLGEDGVRQKNAYERTLPARSLTDKFAGDVAFVDPLSAAQAGRLIRLLVESGASYLERKTSLLDAVDYDAVQRGAAEFLSATQLAHWRETEQLSRWQAVENNLGRTPARPTPPNQPTAK